MKATNSFFLQLSAPRVREYPVQFLYCTGFIDGCLLRRGAAAVECLLADAQTAHVRGHVLAEEGEFTSAGEREFTSAEEGVPDASQRAAG